MTALGSGVRVGVGIGVSACCVVRVAVPGTPVSDGVGAGSTVAGAGAQTVRRGLKGKDKNRIAYLRFRAVLLRIMILSPLPENSRLHSLFHGLHGNSSSHLVGDATRPPGRVVDDAESVPSYACD